MAGLKFMNVGVYKRQINSLTGICKICINKIYILNKCNRAYEVAIDKITRNSK